MPRSWKWGLLSILGPLFDGSQTHIISLEVYYILGRIEFSHSFTVEARFFFYQCMILESGDFPAPSTEIDFASISLKSS